MAKTIIDALVGLNFDDSPSNLATATLFYLLTGDDPEIFHGGMNKKDSGSANIISRANEIPVSCKELKSSLLDDSGIHRPELCPKWIALLTVEKASLSTIALEGDYFLCTS